MQSMYKVYRDVFTFWEWVSEKFIRIENIIISEDKMSAKTGSLATIRIH